MLVNNGTFNNLNYLSLNQAKFYQQPIELIEPYRNDFLLDSKLLEIKDDDEIKLLKIIKLPLISSLQINQNNSITSSNEFKNELNKTKLINNKLIKNDYLTTFRPFNSLFTSISSTLFKPKYLINNDFIKSSTYSPNQQTLNEQSIQQLNLSTIKQNNQNSSTKSYYQQLTSPIGLLNSTKLPIKSILNSNKNDTISSFKNLTQQISQSNKIVYEYPSYIKITATFICSIIFIFGILGNILVSLIIFRSKELRNTTNYFLINLSIADLLVIIVCMPSVLIELNSKPEVWELGEFMCKSIPYLETSVAHSSILTMLAISFERFYAICKPLKVSYKCTKLRAVLIILCIWIIALIATLPLLFTSKLESATYLDGSEVQVCLTSANTALSKTFFLIIIALFFFLPLIILVIIYIAITKKLCSKENISYAESVQMKARRQVVIMLATVIICFFICLLPFRLFTLFLLFVNNNTLDSLGMETYYVYLYTSRVMLYLNSALNPILYNLISSKFRNAFVQIICCRSSSNTNRFLVRQSTFNTTTTTLNNYTVNGFINLTNNDKRNSIQNCSLKQSYSIDTNLKHLDFKNKGRQASLHLKTSASTNGIGFNKDENDNRIIDFNNFNSNLNNNLNSNYNKKLIKQTSFMKEDNDEIDSISTNSLELDCKEDEQKPDVTSNANKKQCYTNANKSKNFELKVSNLQDDLNLIHSNTSKDKKFNFKKILTSFKKKNSTNDKLNESIIEEEDLTDCKIVQKFNNNDNSKESNV